MRSINCTIKNVLLAGMVLVLSASPALAFGENKMVNEKPKIEIIKVEKNKDEKAMLEEEKVKDILGVLRINRLGLRHINLLLDEDLLGEDILDLEE